MVKQRACLWLAGAAACAFAWGAPAAAQDDDRLVVNPPELGAAPDAPSKLLLSQPGLAGGKERLLNLDIVYRDGEIFNPATGAWDKVHLRAYADPTDPPPPPRAAFVSPMIVAAPGETVRIALNNRLPADASCATGDHHINIPHCFNGTNLHSHGLWVNPSGNGDNVLLSINPGVKFQYEYNIPADHPAGTFWYHTHRHGSTALQVSSGMAGALIIRGDRPPTSQANGDLDTLLRDMKEQVLVFQQIQYYCLNDPAQRDTKANETYDCPAGQAGRIESYAPFGPGSWAASGRFTSINGEVLPTIAAAQGEIQRWRMIHGGVRDTIALQFRALKPGVARPDRLAAPQMDAWVKQNCTGAPVPYQLVAADGLTMAAAQETRLATFQPGYRFDALVTLPESRDYCALDIETPEAGSVGNDDVPQRLLGIVSVRPGTATGGDIRGYVQKALIDRARRLMPPDVRDGVIADLAADLRFSRFVPHPDVGDKEVTGYQNLTFNIDVSTQSTMFEVGSQDYEPRPYDPNRVDRQLNLGAVEQWSLQSQFVSHPFHIHVNPFQIVSILDPNGKDVSVPGAVDDIGGKPADPQYPGLKGVWKDTLMIKSLLPGSSVGKAGGVYTITVRTRYQRYIGEFVLHCHILDHEDQGMMQNVAIVLPAGEVGAPGNQLQDQGPGHH
ncbi:multicopper oxidase family protein [Sphingosinicella sp. BN140058]|uniref:multicopper oxidase family protein n=1 Tax=Sphingosinicella sp. BN140058 TaxID=1892855 RepID=UPI00101065D2|nr:multicopper oxidase family protein [Sphingosinicella sp. BN140058]QAY76004.1 multicopper oxidase family protein [Sphingosinicella sp. BN140058]